MLKAENAETKPKKRRKERSLLKSLTQIPPPQTTLLTIPQIWTSKGVFSTSMVVRRSSVSIRVSFLDSLTGQGDTTSGAWTRNDTAFNVLLGRSTGVCLVSAVFPVEKFIPHYTMAVTILLSYPFCHVPLSYMLSDANLLAINYRLSPQYPFPCAIQDAVAAYLYLIEPPPEAKHKPVRPEHIVIIGDSAGGGLSLAALQVIRDSGLPQCAGGVLISPWCDLSHSFPSIHTNTKTVSPILCEFPVQNVLSLN